MNSTIKDRSNNHGEFYAPVYYDPDCTLKLVWKPDWGGFAMCATFMQLAIFDLDDPALDFASICDLVNTSTCRNHLFYVHRTPRGYHLYLMSHCLDYHNPETVDIGMTIKANPTHLDNSARLGFSIRCSRKNSDRLGSDYFVSQFIGSAGQGTINPLALELYNLALCFIDLFELDNAQSLLNNRSLNNLVRLSVESNGYFGNWQMRQFAPLIVIESSNNNGKVEVIDNLPGIITHLRRQTWTARVPYRDNDFWQHAEIYGAKIKRSIQCKILDSGDDYARGFDIINCSHYISFRDLLIVTYNDQAKLKILYEYCRYHPNVLFKIIKNDITIHCLLLSEALHHQSQTAINMLQRLRSDSLKSMEAYNLGYMIQLETEQLQTFIEIGSCGRGLHVPRLHQLYMLLMKSGEFSCNNIDPRGDASRLTNIRQTALTSR